MGGTTLLSSLDMERLARHGLLEYGEFEVELSRNAIKNDPHGQTGVQLKNPLNEDLIQTIAQMEGVAEVSEYKTLEAKFEYNGVTKKENITPFTPDQQALLEKYLVTGTADYSTMSENHEILVLRNEYADYIYQSGKYTDCYDTLPQTRIFCSALCWYGEKAVTADSTV